MYVFWLGKAKSALLHRCHYTCVKISCFLYRVFFFFLIFISDIHFKMLIVLKNKTFPPFYRNLKEKQWVKDILYFEFTTSRLPKNEHLIKEISFSGQNIKKFFKKYFKTYLMTCQSCYWACTFRYSSKLHDRI